MDYVQHLHCFGYNLLTTCKVTWVLSPCMGLMLPFYPTGRVDRYWACTTTVIQIWGWCNIYAARWSHTF